MRSFKSRRNSMDEYESTIHNSPRQTLPQLKVVARSKLRKKKSVKRQETEYIQFDTSRFLQNPSSYHKSVVPHSHFNS